MTAHSPSHTLRRLMSATCKSQCGSVKPPYRYCPHVASAHMHPHNHMRMHMQDGWMVWCDRARHGWCQCHQRRLSRHRQRILASVRGARYCPPCGTMGALWVAGCCMAEWWRQDFATKASIIAADTAKRMVGNPMQCTDTCKIAYVSIRVAASCGICIPLSSGRAGIAGSAQDRVGIQGTAMHGCLCMFFSIWSGVCCIQGLGGGDPGHQRSSPDKSVTPHQHQQRYSPPQRSPPVDRSGMCTRMHYAAACVCLGLINVCFTLFCGATGPLFFVCGKQDLAICNGRLSARAQQLRLQAQWQPSALYGVSCNLSCQTSFRRHPQSRCLAPTPSTL